MNDLAARARSAPVVLGVSLKLYLDLRGSLEWARTVAHAVRHHTAVQSGAVELFVLPSLPALPAVARAFSGTRVRIGAQDLHWEDRGAFTGAVSGADLRELGCTFVEVGHAERRAVFGETDQIVRGKLAAAFRNGLTPVLCVGEQDRVSTDEAAAECIRQAESALDDRQAVRIPRRLVVAYEPRWAIGASQPASADHVRAIAQALRSRLAPRRGPQRLSVIYGGSAQHGTLTSLGDSVDGIFLGRFAHRPLDLARMIDEAAALR